MGRKSLHVNLAVLSVPAFLQAPGEGPEHVWWKQAVSRGWTADVAPIVSGASTATWVAASKWVRRCVVIVEQALKMFVNTSW